MQVRLAFALATAVRPDILIVDEALAVGDVFFQQKCFERIRAFRAAGTTLLFVSHAMGTVYSLCDRAILIHEGRITLDASPREVIDLYNALALQHRDAASSMREIVASAPAELPLKHDEVETAASSPMNETAIGSFCTPGVEIAAIDMVVDGAPAAALMSESLATVRVRVQFSRPYQDPHIGFQIRNARGESVFMTNTYCMRRSIGPVAQGEGVVAEFSFKAALAPGEYTITAGVADGGAGEGDFRESLARLQDARAFSVLRNIEAIVWSGTYNLDPQCQLHRLAR
jgi:lipopolysaccharide transport system ATP-binding protein